MAQLSHAQYEQLERALAAGTKLSVMRRGTEFVIIPRALRLRGGREAIEARNPTTGDDLVILLDEIDSFEVVG